MQLQAGLGAIIVRETKHRGARELEASANIFYFRKYCKTRLRDNRDDMMMVLNRDVDRIRRKKVLNLDQDKMLGRYIFYFLV